MLLDMSSLGYVKIYLRLETGDSFERVRRRKGSSQGGLASRVGFATTFISLCLQSSALSYSNSSPIWPLARFPSRCFDPRLA